MNETSYSATEPSIYEGRTTDIPNEYLSQHIQCLDINHSDKLKNISVGILGFCSDEGIRRNQGRVGAFQGPKAIRTQLGRLAMTDNIAKLSIADVGDIDCIQQELEIAQLALAEAFTKLQQSQKIPILLGGGHEIAYGHFMGLKQSYPDMNIAIINIDAHFDLRGNEINPISSSGSSFFQIAKLCQQSNSRFVYHCIGIQPHANPPSLFARAKELKVSFTLADEVSNAESLDKLQEIITSADGVYLSICMDAFSQIFAPGVSAPQILGLEPRQVWPYLDLVIQSKKLLSMDVAETSPVYDLDNRTSKLAALIVHRFLDTIPSKA